MHVGNITQADDKHQQNHAPLSALDRQGSRKVSKLTGNRVVVGLQPFRSKFVDEK